MMIQNITKTSKEKHKGGSAFLPHLKAWVSSLRFYERRNAKKVTGENYRQRRIIQSPDQRRKVSCLNCDIYIGRSVEEVAYLCYQGERWLVKDFNVYVLCSNCIGKDIDKLVIDADHNKLYDYRTNEAKEYAKTK